MPQMAPSVMKNANTDKRMNTDDLLLALLAKESIMRFAYDCCREYQPTNSPAMLITRHETSAT